MHWLENGMGEVSVQETSQYGCVSAAFTSADVEISPLPNPSYDGVANICIGSMDSVIHTVSGLSTSTFGWQTYGAGVVLDGKGTSTVAIKWIERHIIIRCTVGCNHCLKVENEKFIFYQFFINTWLIWNNDT